MAQQLDASQRQFCEAPEGNIRLLAPAGCGKTLCLLHRCKHLARQNRQRPRFLFVTFTRAARDELLARINTDSEFSVLRDAVEVTTLNSWGYRRVKGIAFHPHLITSRSDYHFTMSNQLQPVWQNHASVKYAIDKKRNTTPRALMDVMDTFKSLGFDHERHTHYDQFADHLQFLQGQGLTRKLQQQFEELAKLSVLETRIVKDGVEVPHADAAEVYENFYLFWREAAAQLINSATFTMEDQKYVAYLDERQKLEERNFLSGAARYRHIFVDEFQDINPLDIALVKAIVERNRATVTIAGDDDQAIFEWRGATPEYILDPEMYFGSPFATHILEVNYRSPGNIVRHSQQLIAHNLRRVSKNIGSAHGNSQAQIQIEKTEHIQDALEYVHNLFKEAIAQGKSPSRVAIVGRKRSQIIPYQVFFASQEIPFCAAEDLQVFLSDTFDRLLELLLIKTRPGTRQPQTQVVSDLLKLCDLVKRYPISKKDKDSLTKHLQQARPTTISAGVDALSLYRGTLKGANAEGQVSSAMANAIRSFMESSKVSKTLWALSEDFEGLQLDFGKAPDSIFHADPPFLQLAEYASSYGDDYGRFVDDIELAKQQLVHIPPFDDDNPDNVPAELWKRPMHLMTALRAKGKEFDTVVLLDVIDGIWPSRYASTEQEREAERRVFYVAFTRAKQKVVMLTPARVGDKQTVISPYIQELELPG